MIRADQSAPSLWRLALHGGATQRAVWLFWIDFVVYPTLAVALTALYCRSLAWVGLAGLGFVLFTVVEYWMHRVPLHGMFYHGSHDRHHTHPMEYVLFPIYYTPLMFAGFFLLLPTSVFAGFVLGYVWFLVWHHVLHHVDLNSWPRFVRRYAIWHLAHHHDERVNFGITLPVWDWLFGTYRP